MKNFKKYFIKFKKPLILGPIYKLIETITELIIPLLIAEMIDSGVANKDVNLILKYGLIVLLLNVIGIIFAIISHKYAARASVGIATNIRSDLYKKVNTFSHAELDKYSIATINNRLTHDVTRVQQAIGAFVRTVMRTPFLLVGSLILAMTIDIKLSLIFLVVAPLVYGSVNFILKKTVPLYDKSQKNLDKVSGITKENIEGIRVVRAFNKQPEEQVRFEQSAKDLAKSGINMASVSALLSPINVLILNFAIVAVLWFGGIQVNIGGLSQGKIIAFINYLTQISTSLIRLANIIVVFIKAINCGKRINEILDQEVSIVDDTVKYINQTNLNNALLQTGLTFNKNTTLEDKLTTPLEIYNNETNNQSIEPLPLEKGVRKTKPKFAFEFNNVSFAYSQTAHNAVNNLNVKIKHGQTIGIIGGTGSGKSSVTYLLPRFYDTTQGEVLVNGKNVKDYNLVELRNLFGIVPQRAVLYSGTIRENMQFRQSDATDEEIYRALMIAQAYEFVKELDDKLNHVVQAGGKNFSGGQRQRLTIARALVGKPEILILDDSASALDFQTDANLRQAIKNHTNKMTVVLISQRVNSIKHADVIIVMDAGNIVGQGKHEKLLKTCSIYKEIYDSQNK